MVHGPGPKGESTDPGSMFCPSPNKKHEFIVIKRHLAPGLSAKTSDGERLEIM